MTGISLGLREALKNKKNEPAFMIEAPGQPEDPDNPISLHFDPDSPADSVAVIRRPHRPIRPPLRSPFLRARTAGVRDADGPVHHTTDVPRPRRSDSGGSGARSRIPRRSYDRHVRAGEDMVDAHERWHGGTVGPCHVEGLTPCCGPVGQAVTKQGHECLVPPGGVEVTVINIRFVPERRMERSTAASASFHSSDISGSGASVWTTRSATGPAGVDRVASTM